MNYFKPKEFKCKCGQCDKGFCNMKKSTLNRLELAREMAEIRFTLTSAMRCEVRNLDEGGSPTSSHLAGYAVDIEASSSGQRFRILKALIAVGFTRIGIGKTFIHADDDPNKPPEVAWLY